MSNKITIKRSSQAGKVPQPGDLEYGEFALNYTDGNLFFKSNANVITNLASTQFVSVTGNVEGGNIVTAGQITATGNISGNYFVGNGSQLTGITAEGGKTTFSSSPPSNPAQGDNWIDADTGVQYIYFNDGTSSQWAEMEAATSIAFVTGSAVGGSNTQLQFNSDGNLAGSANLTWNGTELSVDGTANVTGNISGNYFIGNGSQLTGLPEGYANANVAAYLPTYTGNLVSLTGNVVTTGNITAGNILSNGYYYANGIPLAGGSASNVYFLQGTTTNNTETELFVNGESNNRIAVPLDTSVYYTVEIACKRTNGTDFAAFSLKSMANNSSNTVTDVGSVYEIVVVRTDASIAVDVRADDTNNSIGVFVTGVTGKSLSWTAQVTVIEV